MIQVPPRVQRVVQLLEAGWPVTRVMDATTWPRRAIERAAAEAGLLRHAGTDTWHRAGKPRPAPGYLERLIERASESSRPAVRKRAAALRTLARALEQDLERDAAAAAHDGYPVSEVREWAREQGLNPPAHGRYLPVDIVEAWRRATGR